MMVLIALRSFWSEFLKCRPGCMFGAASRGVLHNPLSYLCKIRARLCESLSFQESMKKLIFAFLPEVSHGCVHDGNCVGFEYYQKNNKHLGRWFPDQHRS
ncbi:hypothetical protein KC19_2G253400 [Ceratodon purpureus]|uniref:Uncharacterized protein n=1 Tax=Ceratodon purpureus TaxID=3225 RepID=A0A8T0J024_CERPU|nr:hypothetical protein KC19_2G253400 [Ceratodon purpureus]